MARQLGRSLHKLDSSIVLSGPQCAESMKYQLWLSSQSRDGQVGFCIQQPWQLGRRSSGWNNCGLDQILSGARLPAYMFGQPFGSTTRSSKLQMFWSWHLASLVNIETTVFQREPALLEQYTMTIQAAVADGDARLAQAESVVGAEANRLHQALVGELEQTAEEQHARVLASGRM